jgi:hypothetical protein
LSWSGRRTVADVIHLLRLQRTSWMFLHGRLTLLE